MCAQPCGRFTGFSNRAVYCSQLFLGQPNQPLRHGRVGAISGITSLSAQRLFEEVFPPNYVYIKPYGNVLAATAFLYGITAQELRKKELEYFDPDYEALIGLRAMKPSMR
jgi:hypothetical protein